MWVTYMHAGWCEQLVCQQRASHLRIMQFSSSESQCSITDSCMMNLPFFRCTVKQAGEHRGWVMRHGSRCLMSWSYSFSLGLALWVSAGESHWSAKASSELWFVGNLLCTFGFPVKMLVEFTHYEMSRVQRSIVWGCETQHSTSAFNTSCFWRILWPILRTILLKSLGSARFFKCFWK